MEFNTKTSRYSHGTLRIVKVTHVLSTTKLSEKRKVKNQLFKSLNYFLNKMEVARANMDIFRTN